MELATEAVIEHRSFHARLYKAVALIDAGLGARAAQRELNAYFDQFVDEHFEFDPLAFYVMYLIWKEEKSLQTIVRLKAADALRVFKCFPNMASVWLDDDDDLDEKVVQEGIDVDEIDDDEECIEILSTDPDQQWKLAKLNHGVSSPSMDKLMALTGMREVKARAVTVCKEVLLAKKRPPEIKAQVAMNFLFVGNPGTVNNTSQACLHNSLIVSLYIKG